MRERVTISDYIAYTLSREKLQFVGERFDDVRADLFVSIRLEQRRDGKGVDVVNLQLLCLS